MVNRKESARFLGEEEAGNNNTQVKHDLSFFIIAVIANSSFLRQDRKACVMLTG